MRWTLALVLGVSVLTFAAGCSKKTSSGGGCTSADQCQPGETCVDTTCRQVCSSDRDCSGTTPICEDSLCREGQRTDGPQVDRVDSDGPVDPTTTHTGHYLGQRLVIYGSNLSGAGVNLVSGTTPTPLEICASTPTTLTVLLPDDTTDGLYTLRVSTQATGSCEVPLQLLQGVTGTTGTQGIQGIPGVPCAGCVDTGSLAANAVTTAKIADGTLGSADVDANQIQRRLSSTCTAGQVVASVAEDGTVTCGGPYVAAWTAVAAVEDFQSTLPGGWTINSVAAALTDISTCGAGTSILGGYNKWATTDVAKSLTGLTTHSELRIVFNLWSIDSGDAQHNDRMVVALDGVNIWENVLMGSFGTQLCGSTTYNDHFVRIDLAAPHAGATAQFKFSGRMDEGAGNESWGIDNFRAYYR